ncbi:hypothetical protein H6F51_01075 [Cyanobacteria bacterium FACHB-DQ100]|nr:hypothetical protein [Cyanobacteria bacterium FACHB-DQ100]
MAPPLLEETPLNKLVPTRIDLNTYEDLLLVVKHKRITQAQVIRQAIRLYLKQELATLRPTIGSSNAC